MNLNAAADFTVDAEKASSKKSPATLIGINAVRADKVVLDNVVTTLDAPDGVDGSDGTEPSIKDNKGYTDFTGLGGKIFKAADGRSNLHSIKEMEGYILNKDYDDLKTGPRPVYSNNKPMEPGYLGGYVELSVDRDEDREFNFGNRQDYFHEAVKHGHLNGSISALGGNTYQGAWCHDRILQDITFDYNANRWHCRDPKLCLEDHTDNFGYRTYSARNKDICQNLSGSPDKGSSGKPYYNVCPKSTDYPVKYVADAVTAKDETVCAPQGGYMNRPKYKPIPDSPFSDQIAKAGKSDAHTLDLYASSDGYYFQNYMIASEADGEDGRNGSGGSGMPPALFPKEAFYNGPYSSGDAANTGNRSVIYPATGGVYSFTYPEEYSASTENLIIGAHKNYLAEYMKKYEKN